jgi:beta-N-acetylhexosaminidase
MTLEQKVGQLFVNHVYGAAADTADNRNTTEYGVATPAQIIATYHLGGVSYFTWSANIANPRQIAKLSNGLQQAAISTGANVPLLIGTDQETGSIVRVGPPATQFPGAMALGATQDVAAARDAAAITGKELAAMGINQDYAPVGDVNLNPGNPVIGVRSFGEDPEKVADFTTAQVNGYQRQAGIVATAKHFPGHGDTRVDSHTGIPEITHTREQWETIDAVPFKRAIAAGLDMIMTGHLVFPALDPSKDPATLSKPIMTGILRHDLGFQGVIITDALGMQGVRDKYGDDRVPVLAINAGVDMLLRPPNFRLAYNAVLEAARNGEITTQRLNEAVTRILRLKSTNRDPFVDELRVDRVVGAESHRTRAAKMTNASITVVRNDAQRLPLRQSTAQKVFVTGYGVTATQTLANEATKRGHQAGVFQTGTKPSNLAIETAVTGAQQADLVFVLTMKAWDTQVTDPEARQQRLVHELVATGKPVVVVAVQEPYDIGFLAGVETFVVTYVPTITSIQALAQVLYGEIAPRGKLPVTIPSGEDPAEVLYEAGHGLTW